VARKEKESAAPEEQNDPPDRLDAREIHDEEPREDNHQSESAETPERPPFGMSARINEKRCAGDRKARGD
jgi:hypothetical protein